MRVRTAETGDEEAIALLAYEYISWLDRRLLEEDGLAFPPTELDELREEVRRIRERGVYLVAELDGRLVGIGAVHLLPDGSAVLKRMFVRAEARSRGLGSELLDRLLEEARNLGAGMVRLETMPMLTAARELYRSRGFVETDAYEGTDIPEELRGEALFLERRLDG